MPDSCDLTQTLLALADEPAGTASPAEVTRRTLEGIRRHTGAAVVVLWKVTEATADRLFQLGPAPPVPRSVALGCESIALERLRRNGAIRCSLNELTGVEPLVPGGVRAYIAAAATHGGSIVGVLTLGWHLDTPPCDDRGTADLRAIASLLLRPFVVSAGPASPPGLHAAIVDSFVDPIVVLDREGTVMAVNSAWDRRTTADPVFLREDVGIGVNYLDLYRRAAADGSAAAARALAGLTAVCTGESQSFDLAYQVSPAGETRWWLMRAIPFHRSAGGTVVRHTEVTGTLTTQFEHIVGSERFRELADAVAVPIFEFDDQDVLTFGNRAWREATGGRAASGSPWTSACHPDDQERLLAAMPPASDTRNGSDAEVRLLAADGSYRWCQVTITPLSGPDGAPRHFVGTCRDITLARHAQQALQDAGARLIASQEAVRTRIARELHDDIGQQVIILTTRLDSVVAAGRSSLKQLEAVMRQTQAGLQELARGVHNLSHELHPAKLRLLGLKRTVAALARDVGANGVTVTFESHGVTDDLPDDRALCIFRIAQEALQNAVKHSGAHAVDVTLTGTPADVTLTVADDGAGFDSLSLTTGLGLLTMRERVELIGGTLRIHTAPESGTTIAATVPVGATDDP